MTESATLLRKQATASRLTSVCRRLTIERGLSGYTIDEACAETGISRRTFFNYFPSKEDAVLGLDEIEESRFREEFLTRGSRGWAAVVDDLLDAAAQHAESAGLNATDHLQFMGVLEREPRLLARFIGLSRERELALLTLVVEREGVNIDDEFARASVGIVMTVLRAVGDRLTDPHIATDFGAALTTTLAALRAVLIPTAGKASA
jgi:AcrR family transcriptional regulator